MPRGRPIRSAAERRYLPADRCHGESIYSPPAAALSVDFLVLDENITSLTTPSDPGTSPAVEQRRWDIELGLPANYLAASPCMRIEERSIKLSTGIKKAQLVRIYEDNFQRD